MKKIIVAVLVSGIAFASCKKKDKEPAKAELLQKGKWKLAKAEYLPEYGLGPAATDWIHTQEAAEAAGAK